MQIDWSKKNIQEIELFFSTNINTGLDRESYKNARTQYGANTIKSKILEKQNFYGLEKKKNNIKSIFSQAINIFGIIYIALLIILSLMNTEINIYAIIPFLGFSIISTFVLSNRSDEKQAYLYKLCRPKALVMRGGKRIRVFIENIVPGDLLILSAGDIVPADARLVTANSLSCIEIMSENKTMHKNKTDKILDTTPSYFFDWDDPTINSNIVFATDIIASGNGFAIVIATGKRTRIVREFRNLEYNEGTGETGNNIHEYGVSCLQKEASGIANKFSLVSIVFAVALLILGILMQRDLEFILLISFTVVASMFADKLPVITDFAVMQGMISLSSRGILIKKSATVDKLNSIDTIIARKTETYIRDILKLQKIYYNHWEYEVSPKNTMQIGQILSYMALCSNVGEARTKKGSVIYTGLPVDVAAVKAFQKCGLDFTGLYGVYQRYGKTMYDPLSGIKSVLVYGRAQNSYFSICFGEAETVLRRCARRESGNYYVNLDRQTFDIYKRKIEDLYESYDLVMAVAIKNYGNNARNINLSDNNLDLIGIISFSEADVFGVYENIEYLKKGGVSPVMIVDVNNATVQRAAKRLGIVGNKHTANSGRILDDAKIARIGDGVFYANADKYKLFMPISIQNRVKFLKALRFRKKTSAVTVSTLAELPVLTESDVSFTQAAVETGVLTNKASVILKILSISEISNAVKGAVVIYKNVYGIISFAASLFTAQYLLVFLALILDGRYLLNAVQLIWSGVIVGYMCAISMCFGEDTNEWYVTRSKLKNHKKYSRENIKSGILTGVIIFFTTILSFFVCLIFKALEVDKNIGIADILSEYIGSDKFELASLNLTFEASLLSAQTGGFIALIFACLTIALINIKPTHLFDLSIFKNAVFVGTAAGNIILLIAAVTITPLREVWGFDLLPAKSMIFAILIGIIIPAVYMIVKAKKSK